jgi:hypothetical protein
MYTHTHTHYSVVRGVSCNVFNLFVRVPLKGTPGEAYSNLTIWSHTVNEVEIPLRFLSEFSRISFVFSLLFCGIVLVSCSCRLMRYMLSLV